LSNQDIKEQQRTRCITSEGRNGYLQDGYVSSAVKCRFTPGHWLCRWDRFR
jgi:hypothetical protein